MPLELLLVPFADSLGSVVTAVTDEAGAVVERMSYDAWGKRRNTDGSDDPASVIKGQSTPHGFTEHEMLDSISLVHMNGRLYDPLVGRFVSADPNVFYPDDLQDFNRYSYVHNNPLSLTDPDGFIPYSNGVYDGGFNSSRQLSSVSTINLSFLRSGIDRGLSNPSTGIFVGGGVNSSNLGMSSTPFLFNAVGSGVKTIGSYMFPSIAALGNRGEPGTWADFGAGYVKEGLNAAKGMLGTFNPVLKVLPSLSIGNQELSGAATYEGAGTLLSLGMGPLARIGGGVAKSGAGFADEARLLSHFEKHGAEFGVKSADEYLQVGRDIMQQGQKVQYLYKGEPRTGYAQFMGNTSSGNARFGFVGTNADGAITTIHTQSGNSFWKLLNASPADKTIRPIP